MVKESSHAVTYLNSHIIMYHSSMKSYRHEMVLIKRHDNCSGGCIVALRVRLHFKGYGSWVGMKTTLGSICSFLDVNMASKQVRISIFYCTFIFTCVLLYFVISYCVIYCYVILHYVMFSSVVCHDILFCIVS